MSPPLYQTTSTHILSGCYSLISLSPLPHFLTLTFPASNSVNFPYCQPRKKRNLLTSPHKVYYMKSSKTSGGKKKEEKLHAANHPLPEMSIKGITL